MARFSIKRYLPRSLYGRAALILLVPIVTIQLVVSFAFIQRLYEDVTEQMTHNLVPQIAVLLELAETDPASLEARATALALRAEFPGRAVDDSVWFYDLSGKVVRETLSDSFAQLAAADLTADRKQVRLGFELPQGLMEVSFPRSRVSARNPHQLLVWMVLTGALMTVIAYLFLRNQLRPIRRLARAAEAFGKGRVEPYFPSGANEVRSAGNAFLNMRARIERQTQQRTMMLSGVSHDLRTPLTRLKLGLSMQPETADTKALLGDVGEMENLIEAFLNFARSDATEALAASDLAALVQGAVDKARRAGRDVSVGEVAATSKNVKIRPQAIERALDNLIGNAVRYGGKVLVSLDAMETAYVIRIEDNGPGIPADKREEALKPFARLDTSRNQNKGSGVGLGLAIAADIVRGHGGTLRLQDSAAMGGLSAEIVLPR